MTPEQIIKKFDVLKSGRGVWEEHWQEVMQFVLPRKDDVIKTETQGQKKGQLLFDSTAILANELLAGALHGLLTNPSVEWFDLTTGIRELDENDQVRLYLDQCRTSMHVILNNSNFQTETHEIYLDLGSAGTAGLLMEEDDERVIRFSAKPISELYIEENNKGVVDVVYRLFKWNARQIVLQFGYDNVSEFIQNKYDQNAPDTFEIIHAVFPRDMASVPQAKRGTPKGYPIASYYILKHDKSELEVSGFFESPWAVPRWTKTSHETYGRSPGMKALPDIKMLNEMKLTTLRSAQKQVDPPLQLPDEGYLLPLKTNPGGLNYYRSGSQDRIEPLKTEGRVDFGMQAISDTKQTIREAFYIDQLQLGVGGPQMTATEVQQRTEQQMRFLGPVLGRQNSEYLSPIITRLFGIMKRKKLLPPNPPQVLLDKKIRVHYSSLVAKAQRAGEAQNIQRMFAAATPFIQADQKVLDLLNGDEGLKYLAQIYGLPETILRSKKEIDKLRQARDKANQAMLQQQQQQHEADQISKIAPAASQAKQAGLI